MKLASIRRRQPHGTSPRDPHGGDEMVVFGKESMVIFHSGAGVPNFRNVKNVNNPSKNFQKQFFWGPFHEANLLVLSNLLETRRNTRFDHNRYA